MRSVAVVIDEELRLQMQVTVFVIVDPARTAKFRAVPSLGWVAASAAPGQAPTIRAVIRTSSETRRELLDTPPTMG